jgi:hypothetical protein
VRGSGNLASGNGKRAAVHRGGVPARDLKRRAASRGTRAERPWWAPLGCPGVRHDAAWSAGALLPDGAPRADSWRGSVEARVPDVGRRLSRSDARNGLTGLPWRLLLAHHGPGYRARGHRPHRRPDRSHRPLGTGRVRHPTDRGGGDPPHGRCPPRRTGARASGPDACFFGTDERLVADLGVGARLTCGWKDSSGGRRHARSGDRAGSTCSRG